MVEDDLRTAIEAMVARHGFETVSRVLREMEARHVEPNTASATAEHKRPRSRGARTKQRQSAVHYVRAMKVPAEHTKVVERAAEEFEQRSFLPTLSDVRRFCEVYGIEEPRSKSRTSGIPRVFKFLLTMDVADIERMLDDRMFSGPAELGPIADAIRGKASEYREAEIGRTDFVPSERRSRFP